MEEMTLASPHMIPAKRTTIVVEINMIDVEDKLVVVVIIIVAMPVMMVVVPVVVRRVVITVNVVLVPLVAAMSHPALELRRTFSRESIPAF